MLPNCIHGAIFFTLYQGKRSLTLPKSRMYLDKRDEFPLEDD
ncbi:hypothetical protein ACSQ6I_03195 [Anabaena sp. WFMT]